MSRDEFSTYHPIINFLFFCAVIGFCMVYLHPVFLGISLLGSFSYAAILNGKGMLRFTLIFIVPMMLVAGLVNPLFNHRGMTILGYICDNPITLESIIYGIAISIMFGTVIVWFSCVNKVMSGDKITHLFGSLLPVLSMVFSMSLRFVPRLKRQILIIHDGQKCIGHDATKGGLGIRIKQGTKIISIAISWALENAIDTADSMRSRGASLSGRTRFAMYRFDARDRIILIGMCLMVVIILIGSLMGVNTVEYFPSIEAKPITAPSLFIYLSYFLLCFMPSIINIWEAAKWRYLRSKI